MRQGSQHLPAMQWEELRALLLPTDTPSLPHKQQMPELQRTGRRAWYVRAYQLLWSEGRLGWMLGKFTQSKDTLMLG